MDVGTVKNVAIVAILLGVAYIAYMSRDKLGCFLMPHKKKPKAKEKGQDAAMAEVCKSFLMYADNFNRLYEPLYKASVGEISRERMKNVLTEWDIRMENIGKAPFPLKSWWATVAAAFDNLSDKELQERAYCVVQMVFSCGIVRDTHKELIAVQDTNMFYQDSDGRVLSEGQRLMVESPCWYLSTTPPRIIEKGYCVINEN